MYKVLFDHCCSSCNLAKVLYGRCSLQRSVCKSDAEQQWMVTSDTLDSSGTVSDGVGHNRLDCIYLIFAGN